MEAYLEIRQRAYRIATVTEPPVQNAKASEPLVACYNALNEQIIQLRTLSFGSARPSRRRSRSPRRSTSRDRLQQLDPGETEPAVRKHGMRRQSSIPPHLCHRQEIEDLPHRHRRRYMRIPGQQTTRICEQRYVRAVRGQRMTHCDLRYHPSVPRHSIASSTEMAFYNSEH